MSSSVFAVLIHYKLIVFPKVAAFDVDSNQNGEIQFENLNGNELVKESFQIDVNTGELFLLTNDHIDRETNESAYFVILPTGSPMSNCFF